MKLTEQTITHIIIGSGAAGFQAALRLYQNGERDLAIITENIKSGTSRNTGSDKQTYYKLTLSGNDADSSKKYGRRPVCRTMCRRRPGIM